MLNNACLSFGAPLKFNMISNKCSHKIFVEKSFCGCVLSFVPWAAPKLQFCLKSFPTTLYFYSDLGKTWIFALCLILRCISAVFCETASRCLSSKCEWEGCDDRLLRFTCWIPNQLLDNFTSFHKDQTLGGGSLFCTRSPSDGGGWADGSLLLHQKLIWYSRIVFARCTVADNQTRRHPV